MVNSVRATNKNGYNASGKLALAETMGFSSKMWYAVYVAAVMADYLQQKGSEMENMLMTEYNITGIPIDELRRHIK
jgi:hypothetical protein